MSGFCSFTYNQHKLIILDLFCLREKQFYFMVCCLSLKVKGWCRTACFLWGKSQHPLQGFPIFLLRLWKLPLESSKNVSLRSCYVSFFFFHWGLIHKQNIEFLMVHFDAFLQLYIWQLYMRLVYLTFVTSTQTRCIFFTLGSSLVSLLVISFLFFQGNHLFVLITVH